MPDRLSAYEELVALLDHHGVAYRIVEHPPEGRTDIVSAFRGHPVAAAAKCIIVLAKLGRKVTKYVLCVVPGDSRVDLAAVKTLIGATYVGFAGQTIAEELGRAISGAILPFALDDRLELIADPRLLDHPEIFFNAARLDRSVALSSADYARIAVPHLARIARV